MDPNQQNPQEEPVKANDAQPAVTPATSHATWMSKEDYEKAVAARVAAEQASQNKTSYGKLIKQSSVVLAVLIIAVVALSFSPLGELLPVITKEAESGSRGYMPASPVIGLLYLAITITICFQIGVGIAAARKNRRNKPGKGLLAVVAIIVTIGIFGGGPILFAPLILLALITCNFNPCQGT